MDHQVDPAPPRATAPHAEVFQYILIEAPSTRRHWALVVQHYDYISVSYFNLQHYLSDPWAVISKAAVSLINLTESLWWVTAYHLQQNLISPPLSSPVRTVISFSTASTVP